MQGLQGLCVLALRGLFQFGGHQLHGACGHAAPATDAGGGLAQGSLPLIKGQDGVVLL